MLGTARCYRFIYTVSTLGASKSFETTVDSFVKIWIDVELLLINRFGLFFRFFRWCLRLGSFPNFLDLNAGIKRILLLVKKDSRCTVIVELHFLVTVAGRTWVKIMNGTCIILTIFRWKSCQVSNRRGVNFAEAAFNLFIVVKELTIFTKFASLKCASR